MTSLAQQLRKIAAPQTNILDHQKKKASILFSSSDAATFTRETYYQLGVSGFLELVEVNNQFNNFKESLFGVKTKDLQRFIQTQKVNEELDKTIEKFLLLVSPYLQKQSSLKTLEWLVHRFYINEKNVDALMMCVFPYYETLLFTRIVQVIDTRSEQSPWHWIYKGIRRGLPISKQTVFLHWSSSQWFRNFLSNYFHKVIKIHKEEKNLQMAVSLLMSTQIGGLASADVINEDHISSVCQTLQKCLSLNNRDVLTGVFLVVNQLSISVHLTHDMLIEIIKKIVQISDPLLIESSALCLLTLFYHQNIKTLPPSVVRSLEANELLLARIAQLSCKKPVSPFLSVFVKEIIKLAMTDEDLSIKEKKGKLMSVVDYLVAMPLSPSESSKILRSFLHGIAEYKSYLKGLESSLNLVQVMKAFETNHPDGFDKACAHIKKASAKSGKSYAFERKLIEKFKTEYVLKVKSIKMNEGYIAKTDTLEEEQWLKCLNSGKLISSCVKFLEKVCATISLPDNKKNRPFWHICGEDDFSTSLKLLIKILRVVVFHQIQKTNSKLCSDLLKQIFNEILGKTKSKLYFLSMIFGWNLEAENVGIDRCLKLWALNLTSAILASESSSCSLSWVLDAKEPLLSSLIIPICEGEFLCQAAYSVLQQMHSIVGGRLKSNNLSVLVEELILSKEEISADVSYLPLTIASLAAKKKGLGTQMVEVLFSCVTDKEVPLHIKSSMLYLLSKVNNTDILAHLIPVGSSYLDEIETLKGKEFDKAKSSFLYYILLRFSDNTMFLKVNGGWEMFQRCLQMPDNVLQVSDQVVSPQDLVVNYKLIQELSDSTKQLDVLEALIVRIIKSNVANEASKLSKELKKISLTATQIISLWSRYNLVPQFSSIREARAKRLKQKKEPRDMSNMEGWRKLALILEFVGVMEDLKEPWLLIGSICDHLQVLMKFESSFADTLQQQILSVLLHLLHISKNKLHENEFIKHCKLNVALIVQCIRSSVNPDTHRRALLILALASEYYPNQVLHNIMAIFTFMGTSLLRRDDAYSFQVIHLTIDSIVPTLIKAETSEPKVLLKKLSQVTQVFVDALPDLAEHRRLPLFKQLATTLGVSRYLWLVMALIADAYVTHTATAEEISSQEEDPRRMPRNIQFALVLYSQFSVIDQLKASIEVADFVVNLPESKESVKGVKNIKDMNSSTLVINVQTRTSRQLRHLKYTCLGLLVHLLSSERFVDQVFEVINQNSETELKELKGLYESLLEKSLEYLKLVCQNRLSYKGTPTAKFWLAMERKLVDLVDAINSLLPPDLLVEVVSGLLRTKSDMIRCKALEILASKLQPDAKFFSDKVASSLVEFIDPLLRIAEDAKEQEENRQTALFTLQLLVRRLHSVVDSELLCPILKSSSSLIKRNDSSTKVVTQAALVVAESIHAMKVFSLIYLDDVAPSLLSILENSLKEGSFLDNLMIATATALHRIVENIPSLLSRNYVEALFAVSCQLIAKHEEEDRQRESKLTNRLTSMLELLVHNLESRVLLPSLTKVFDKLCAEDICSLPSLMQFIESMIGFVKGSEELSLYKIHLTPLFTRAFDVRCTQPSLDSKSLDTIESCVIAAVARFLFKLTGEENVDFVSALLKWALSDEQKPSRLITFFRFTSHLANGLKVLFIKTNIAHVIYPKAAETLDRNNKLLHEDTIFGSGEVAEAMACELLQHVLETLSNIFLYDSVGFTNDSRFKTIVGPLTNQIENTVGTEEHYKTRISNYLKTCIIRLTKAVTDDSLWKDLNSQILLRVRTDNDSKIILAGLEVFEGLVEAMGEDYLQPLLADTIACIIEVLESLDMDVEIKTKEIFNKMEAILGDSLRAYLET